MLVSRLVGVVLVGLTPCVSFAAPVPKDTPRQTPDVQVVGVYAATYPPRRPTSASPATTASSPSPWPTSAGRSSWC